MKINKIIFILLLVIFTYLCPTAYDLSVFSQSMSGGGEHSLYICSDGTGRAVGWNAYGQLGDGTYTNRNTPVQMSSLSGIIAVAAGGYHSLFLKNDSTVWAVGMNSNG